MLALYFLTSFGVALVVSSAMLPVVIRLAHRIGAIDHPGGRRVHDGQIPRLGGIAIFLGFVAGVGAILLVSGRTMSASDPTEYRWLGAGVGACLILIAGVLDDLYQLRARIKLLFQVLAALIAVGSGVTIEAMSSPFGGVIHLGVLGPVVAFCWILVVTNAMNLVDGLDGLAGGIALIITATMASIAIAMERYAVVFLALALAGALVGFLRYNFSPARVFMGDGGSQFLGFILALISIRGSQKGAAAVAIMVPLLVMGLPLVDLTMTILRRGWGSGSRPSGGTLAMVKRIAQADRRHLHHNLLDLGMKPRPAALTLYLIAALFALSGYLFLVRSSLPLAALTLMLSVGSVVVIKLFLAGATPDEPKTAPPKPEAGAPLSR